MLSEKQASIYRYYLALQVANEVILTCAKAEGYINEGDEEPWSKIPWRFDLTALAARVTRRLEADPHFRDLVEDHDERVLIQIHADRMG